ncbi:hypothetical protein OIE63_08030 [Streptomyces sp. NBC_01795]|uniref:hypothetical protein n=1 Tax=unclassified Streptomyces TaxID=2593676 RepID=UPI002DD89075|nr:MULTISPECIES: hypothetical protein [unclassified Streptomyces]WSA91514.1 hypothetical protein OIE63_08030 [Streptomyces sp. NBC_01795]WSB75885.1 hypothetical protein OHB04_08845 [Streptomyces sp. NBC_01775]
MVAVLRATRKLLDRYADDPAKVTGTWESRVVAVVLRHGSRADAEALLPLFVDDPGAREGLLPVLARHGDRTLAARLLEAGTESGRLIEGVPAELLHTVGYLGYEPAERMLWEHVEGTYEEDPCDEVSYGEVSYGEAMSACLGLLHLPCQGLRTGIAAALERHRGSPFFPEFLPALATKTGDPAWLGKLLEWGAGGASTDCNGGLILGIALHGGAARAEFTRLLWDPRWEAHGGGTGADRWAYAGTRVLGLGLPELYAALRARLRMRPGSPEAARHALAVFTALLRLRVARPWLGVRLAAEPQDTCEALYDLLFEWSSPDEDDSLTGLALRALTADDPLLASLYDVARRLDTEARHELDPV